MGGKINELYEWEVRGSTFSWFCERGGDNSLAPPLTIPSHRQLVMIFSQRKGLRRKNIEKRHSCSRLMANDIKFFTDSALTFECLKTKSDDMKKRNGDCG